MNKNIGSICTTLQCESGLAEKVALRLIAPDLSRSDLTFADLEAGSNRFANILFNLGVQHQEVVFVFLPKQAEVFMSVLGTFKFGGIAGVLFSNFGREAVFERLLDSGASVLVTKSSMYSRIKESIRELPALRKIILTDLREHESEEVLSYQKLMEESEDRFVTPPTDPQSPALLHYTSGSTGKPKGVVHVHGAIEHHLLTMEEILQVQEDDIYWCTADQAWVTGVTYGIIGPWAKGVSQIHYSGNFGIQEWFEILNRESVSVWYTAPTALRMLIQQEALVQDLPQEFPCLKRIYSVGEPLNPEIISWVNKRMHKEIYDTWFQTETGGIMISNRPGLKVKPGSMGKPVKSIEPALFSDDGTRLGAGKIGSLRIKKGWPSMFRKYLNMPQAYADKFHGEFYDTGDLAKMDEDGYFWFFGRNDDVINTSGHLVGPFEVESCLLEMDEIVDVAVIGAPDEMLYQKIVAFVKLQPGVGWSKSLEVKCRIHVTNRLSPVAVPSEFQTTDLIPKNRSGKIMRRVLRARYLNEDEGDVSTMEE